MLREAAAVAVVQRQRHALALTERGRNGIGQATAIVLGGGNPVDDHQDILAGTDPCFSAVFVEAHDGTVHLRPHEPGGPELRRDLHIWTMCRLW